MVRPRTRRDINGDEYPGNVDIIIDGDAFVARHYTEAGVRSAATRS